jgi:hypothetical protein
VETVDKSLSKCYRYVAMRMYSTTEAAKELGIHRVNLQKAIASGKITPPSVTTVGGVRVRLWTTKDIERARKKLKKEP